MKKGFIVLIVLGGVLTTAGAVMFGIGLSKEFKVAQTVTKEHVLTESFNKFNIDIDTADLNFYVASDGVNKVVCKEREKQYHEVSVSDNTLVITSKDDLNWYQRLFTFTPESMKVDVYLNANSYENLVVKSATGDIVLPENFTFNDADIKLSTGDVYFSSQVNNNLKIKTSTGNIHLDKLNSDNVVVTLECDTGRKVIEGVHAKRISATSSTGRTSLSNSTFVEDIYIKSSTGNVKIVDSDAATVCIETSTGDVDAVFLTGKSVYPETSTGDISVVPSTGGACSIKTSTGDITVSYKA